MARSRYIVILIKSQKGLELEQYNTLIFDQISFW